MEKMALNVVLYGVMAAKMKEKHEMLGFAYSSMIREALAHYLEVEK